MARGKDMSGIIPAHAGNTDWLIACSLGRRDHPRACGEHGLLGLGVGRQAGSSPRMRGTLLFCFRACRPWIIPAHAGNTSGRCNGECCTWDHPRACGEHAFAASLSAFTAGSSPRMRGTLYAASRAVIHTGIIPAHAGNTNTYATIHAWLRDHPRACGEHFVRWYKCSFVQGSSPRMRGTH